MSHTQMKQACSLPMATGAALMADAHVGYGLPIGGVLALDNAVAPYAVGVDIACRMKMTIFDIPPLQLQERAEPFKKALEECTVFGVGAKQRKKQQHPVMDEDWTITRITRERKETAHKQLGTSGSGNHFVEWGALILGEDDEQLGISAGEYTALLSHSGSRGAGAAVCNVYSGIARDRLPKRYADLGRLAWLDMDSEEGQEYWAAMNLMGDYAAANHDVIHRRVIDTIGEDAIAGVENHHNFAWLEEHGGKNVYVHRKGATPAGEGVLGVIPGSMGDPAYVCARQRQRGEPQVGFARGRPPHEPQEGEKHLQLQRHPQGPREEGDRSAQRRRGRSSGGLQEHQRGHGTAVRSCRNRGALQPAHREDVRRRQSTRRLNCGRVRQGCL